MINNFLDGCLADIVLAGKNLDLLPFGPLLSDCVDFGPGEFCARAVGAASTWHTLPLNGIAVIVANCSCGQVARVTAGWIVTRMQDSDNGQNIAVGELKGDTVGEVGLNPNANRPVSITIPASLPFPAIVGAEDKNLRPESFRKCYTLHANASNTGVGRAGAVTAAPGFVMPNYTIFRHK
jgi:hypothetical protein